MASRCLSAVTSTEQNGHQELAYLQPDQFILVTKIIYFAVLVTKIIYFNKK